MLMTAQTAGRSAAAPEEDPTQPANPEKPWEGDQHDKHNNCRRPSKGTVAWFPIAMAPPRVFPLMQWIHSAPPS